MRLVRGEREGVAQVTAVLRPLGVVIVVEPGKKHRKVVVTHAAIGREWTILSHTSCSPDPRNLAYLRTWARRLARRIEENTR